MESKHTKGEWVRKDMTILNPNSDYRVGNIHEIAQCFVGFDVDGTKDEGIANAKLIAAAPELLEALKDLVWLIEQGATSDEINEAIRLKSNPAIEKATK